MTILCQLQSQILAQLCFLPDHDSLQPAQAHTWELWADLCQPPAQNHGTIVLMLTAAYMYGLFIPAFLNLTGLFSTQSLKTRL